MSEARIYLRDLTEEARERVLRELGLNEALANFEDTPLAIVEISEEEAEEYFPGGEYAYDRFIRVGDTAAVVKP